MTIDAEKRNFAFARNANETKRNEKRAIKMMNNAERERKKKYETYITAKVLLNNNTT